MNVGPSTELKGIVIASEWGPAGNVTAVDIAGFDEERYRIADDQIGRRLHQLVKKTVIVHGRITRENQQTVIHVEHFHCTAGDPLAPASE